MCLCKQLINLQNWYETQLRLLVRWLRNRPDFSLDQAQLDAIPLIVEVSTFLSLIT